MTSSRSSFPWGTIFFIIILVLAITAVFAFPRWWVEIQLSKLPPDVRAIVERFRSEPVEIPADWATPPKAPDDLLALAEKYRAILEAQPPSIPNHLESKLIAGAELSDSEWEEVASILSQVDPDIQAVMELTSHPDYWFGIFPITLNTQGMPDYIPVQAWGHSLRLKAFHEAHQGHYEAAFETLHSLLRLSICHPSDLIIEQLIALALTQSALQPMAMMTKECDDLNLLKGTLNQLNNLAPTIHQSEINDPVLASVLEWIAYERNNGGALDVSPGKTGLDYLNEISDPNSATSRRRRTGLNQGRPAWFQGVIHFWSTITGMHQLLITMSIPNQMEMQLRQESFHSGFDLVLLTLANRIRELETGAKATDQSMFIPDLLSEPLLDPFTENPYLWDASSEVFYSVAPDETDDGNRISYSPTNGTKSVGDFSLR